MIMSCDYARYQITTVVQLSLRNNLVETSSGVAEQLRSKEWLVGKDLEKREVKVGSSLSPILSHPCLTFVPWLAKRGP